MVRVKVGALPRAVKRFPLATPLSDMHAWRDKMRRELEEELEALPRTAAPSRRRVESYTLAADVKR